MSAAHTEGRISFKANGEANSYALFDSAGHWWLSALMNGEMLSERQAANMRRLAACWNACDSLPTELLEKHGITRSGIAKGVEMLCEHRDALLAEVHALKDAARINLENYEFQRNKADKATAALYSVHYALKDVGWHPGRTDDLLSDIIKAKGAEMKDAVAAKAELLAALEKATAHVHPDAPEFAELERLIVKHGGGK